MYVSHIAYESITTQKYTHIIASIPKYKNSDIYSYNCKYSQV